MVQKQTPMGRYRAIMTDTDRSYISGDGDPTENQRAQSVSRVRNRIKEELPRDIEILEASHEELLEELRETVCGDTVGEDTREARERVMALREERNELQEELATARERIETLEEQDRQADVDADLVRGDLERALRELPDKAAGRGAVEDAIARLE